MKVVLLSASTGNGHMSAALAVEAELLERGHDAKTIDVLDHTGSGFKRWYRGGYEVLVRKKPALWGHLYRTSDKKRFNYRFQTALDRLFVQKMRSALLLEKPDWVVCTHSLPQPSLEKWKSRSHFKVGVVVTDLYPQLMWLRGNPDWFFVPGDWSQEILGKRSSTSVGKTTVTGIPIAKEFGRHVSKIDSRQQLGLHPMSPTVLVTSGGIGGGPIGSVVEKLLGLDHQAQTVVVCGRNQEALNVATKVAKKSGRPGAMHIKGHVDSSEMALLMHASDLIVAKPGGITTFEAMASGLPFVVFEPFLIPGQEEKNAEFLVHSGIGVRTRNVDQLFSAVSSLLDNTDQLAAMSDNARFHSKPDAAKRIVDQLETMS